MKVKILEIRKLLIKVLVARKVSGNEAEILADEHLEGELQGKRSHGLMAFPGLVEKISSKPKSIIKKKTGSYIFADANKNFGLVVGHNLAKQAVMLAKKQGVAIVLIKNMMSWLRPSTIAQYIAEQNMIGFVVNSGGNAMIAPPGGFSPLLGTNPIGIGIPTEKNNIIVDMATSKRAWGEVRKALAENTDLPFETYLDNKGNFAKDPREAYSVLAAGDYKGFALALFIEILTGSLIGMPMSQDKTDKADYKNLARGAVILVLNPAFSTNLNSFKKANKKLADKIRKSKKRKGTKVILVPGDRAMIARNKNLKSGTVDLPNALWEKLKNLDSK